MPIDPDEPAETLTAQDPTLPSTPVQLEATTMGDSTMSLQQLRLQISPRSWLRFGVQAETGRGRAPALLGGGDGLGATEHFGLLGVNLRFQIPRRVTPFIEGRVGGGLVATRPDGAILIPGTPLAIDGTGAGWMYTHGVDIGVELYAFKGGFLTAALGWLRTTRQNAGYDTAGAMFFQQSTHDTFLLKLGVVF
jgi:hypothetical protein